MSEHEQAPEQPRQESHDLAFDLNAELNFQLNDAQKQGFDCQPHLQRLVHFYETLSAQSLPQVIGLYDPQARFKDPFNEVVGHAAIAGIFKHMFVQVDAPRFVVTSSIAQGCDAFLVWDFEFRMKRWSAAPQCIRGASHLLFGDDGKVVVHRDYWDPAEELYEKLPVLGALMRMLKRAARR